MEIITSQQNGFNFVHNMIYLSEVDQPLGNSTLLIQELFRIIKTSITIRDLKFNY